jgi:S-disulfanyl-L-cysteine oxidoreductase SoxD
MHDKLLIASMVTLAALAGATMDRTVVAAHARNDESRLNLRAPRVLPPSLKLPRATVAWREGGRGSAAAAVQESSRTVADGVFTDAQASRGAAIYDAECSGCHRADLRGGNGPSLKEQRFARIFAGKDLKTLFTKVATTMPRNAPASLGDNVYLDIVAHMLKENGFPAGPQELAVDALDGIRVVPGQRKPPPPVGDFSYVDVVGCLTAGPGHTWMLTRASEPVAAVPAATPSTLAAPATPLGTHTFHLPDAMAYAPEDHKDQKMYVRGLLIKLPDEQRITISSLEMVSPRCRE